MPYAKEENPNKSLKESFLARFDVCVLYRMRLLRTFVVGTERHENCIHHC